MSQCEAVRTLLTKDHRCQREAKYGGRWCFQHAHSVGGYQLVNYGAAQAWRRAVIAEQRNTQALGVAQKWLRDIMASDHLRGTGMSHAISQIIFALDPAASDTLPGSVAASVIASYQTPAEPAAGEREPSDE